MERNFRELPLSRETLRLFPCIAFYLSLILSSSLQLCVWFSPTIVSAGMLTMNTVLPLLSGFVNDIIESLFMLCFLICLLPPPPHVWFSIQNGTANLMLLSKKISSCHVLMRLVGQSKHWSVIPAKNFMTCSGELRLPLALFIVKCHEWCHS